MVTPKQEKLITLIRENLGNPKSTKTFGELCLEAGYTEGTARNAYLIFQGDGVREGLEDFVDKLKEKRKKAMNYLTDEKLEAERAKDLTDIIDKLTKNIQLLGGKPTEIIDEYSSKSDEELNKIARSGSGTGEEGVGEKTP